MAFVSKEDRPHNCNSHIVLTVMADCSNIEKMAVMTIMILILAILIVMIITTAVAAMEVVLEVQTSKPTTQHYVKAHDMASVDLHKNQR